MNFLLDIVKVFIFVPNLLVISAQLIDFNERDLNHIYQ